jgi:hypothetical protein
MENITKYGKISPLLLRSLLCNQAALDFIQASPALSEDARHIDTIATLNTCTAQVRHTSYIRWDCTTSCAYA